MQICQKLRLKQEQFGKIDQGGRASVTGGKNMDGFIELIKGIVVANGLSASNIISDTPFVTLPGYFRPTKNWDLLVVNNGELIAVIEVKSQIGPSFGNNFNNRCEEAIGSATDLWTAYREGGLGNSAKPFIGYLVLVEDCDKTRTPIRTSSPFFPVFKEFENSTYAKRYEILCDKLMKENLYTNTALILSSLKEGVDGKYTEPNDLISLKRLLISLASHIAASTLIEKKM